MTQPILITGGTGFIGSHTVVTLAQAGQPVVILDNLCNSSPKVLDRLARKVNHACKRVACKQGV